MKKHPHSTLRFNSYWVMVALIVPQLILSTVIGAWMGFNAGIKEIREAFVEWRYYYT